MKRTIFFLSLAAITLFALSMFLSEDGAQNSAMQNTSIEKNITNEKTDEPLTVIEKIPAPEMIQKTTPVPTPMPTVLIVPPKQPPQPRMREQPEIYISGQDNITKGDTFYLEFQINPKNEEIVGLGIDIAFNDNLAKAISVDTLDADSGDNGMSVPGNINSGIISDIAVTKRTGINGKFLIVEFEAVETGNTAIEARITAVNAAYAIEENLKAVKSIEIQ